MAVHVAFLSSVLFAIPLCVFLAWFGGSDSKPSACNVGDPGSILGLGRSPEKEIENHSSTLA